VSGNTVRRCDVGGHELSTIRKIRWRGPSGREDRRTRFAQSNGHGMTDAFTRSGDEGTQVLKVAASH
jgi:hypothetical protein